MSLAILKSRAQLGVTAPPVTIEVFLSGGLPKFSIVGLPEAAVRESKDRVRGAISSCKLEFPQGRITVSLGPADMRKAGGRFDLPIALGILAAKRAIPRRRLENFEFYGELALNGDLRPVAGLLPAAIRAAETGKAIVVPQANGAEASLIAGEVYVASSLLEVTAFLRGGRDLDRAVKAEDAAPANHTADLADVKGQALAKRALEIAAAGRHNLLMSGPPGTGKSMLAQRLPGILPPMSDLEAIETAAVDSVLGRAFEIARWRQRPFRSPHHTASAAALVGGGSDPRPGEISRAHNGVLFLDEFPEFSRHVLEVLREPMESGWITISRAGRQADFPARFQLVAAMNPCPCGYLGDPAGDCRCSSQRIENYLGRISGPLLDRIDLHVQVPRPPVEALRRDAPREESSADVRQRVIDARAIQLQRSNRVNADLHGSALSKAFSADSKSRQLLDDATERLAMSARAYQRVQRVARSIADLAHEEIIRERHVAEALALRQLARRL
ncbi:MAG: YifB family Mg chelatase-like AAA ATPase [Woeseiaceae bacterium]|nr:YifB family Mg chelatase-like AAA ATPase [Woeseiaceae bacterium]